MKRTLLVAVVLFAGCRCRGETVSPDESNKANRPRVETEAVKLCLEGVRGLSRYSDRCESSHLWWGSVDRAVEQLRPACERMTVAPGVHFDRKEVEACNAALEKAPCFANLPPECRIGGALGAGEPCAFGAQCKVGLTCQPHGEGFCGSCVKLGVEGEDCAERGCDEGLVCIEGKCAKPRAVGGACVFAGDCQRPLTCNMAVLGECQAPKKEGETCTRFECDVTLACVDGKCKKRKPPQGPGANCTDSLECLDYACVHGVCGEPLRLGAACGEESAPCAASFMCVGGKCVLPDARECK